jgi:hypothetical protein
MLTYDSTKATALATSPLPWNKLGRPFVLIVELDSGLMKIFQPTREHEPVEYSVNLLFILLCFSLWIIASVEITPCQIPIQHRHRHRRRGHCWCQLPPRALGLIKSFQRKAVAILNPKWRWHDRNTVLRCERPRNSQSRRGQSACQASKIVTLRSKASHAKNTAYGCEKDDLGPR